MKLLSLLGLLCGLSGQALAQEFGYIRVEVVQQNHQHNRQVNLYANGLLLGPPFSHSTSGFGWVPLSKGHLSPFNSKTQIKVSYDNLESQGCEFDFVIYFSMDRSGGKMLGRYRAPISVNLGSIPLGLLCGAEANELCSSDSNIQAMIVRAHNRKLVDGYNRWKREYDQRLKNKMSAQDRDSDLLNDQLRDKETPSNDENLKLLEAQTKEWEKQVQEMVDKARAEAQDQNTDAIKEINTDQIKADAEKASQLEDANRLRDSLERLQKTSPDAISTSIFNADRNMGIIIDYQKEGLETDRLLGDEDSARATKAVIRELESVRRNVIHGLALIKAMKLAYETYELSNPALTTVNICEVAIGRKKCFLEKISTKERLQKACHMAIYHFPVLAHLRKGSKFSKEETEVFERLEALSLDRTCEKFSKSAIGKNFGVTLEEYTP